MSEVARIKAAVVYKVQTLAAGGFRVTIDGTSQELREAAALMAYADTPGALLDVSFRQVEVLINNGKQLDAISERTERKSAWKTA